MIGATVVRTGRGRIDVTITRDAGGFEESKHPRGNAKNAGQFASSPGGGAKSKPKSAASNEYVNNYLATEIKAHGYKKLEGSNPIKYVDPKGNTITVHPPTPGKNSSSSWTSTVAGKKEFTGSGLGLAAHLARIGIAKTGEGAKPKAKTVQTPAGPVTVHPPEPEKKITPTVPAMQTHAPQPEPEKKSYAASSPSLQNVDVAKKNGYESAGLEQAAQGGTIGVYKKGDATIEVHADNGQWLAHTPGHLTKTGNGPESLALLLSGKPPGPNPPWQNSSQTTLVKQAPAPAPKEAEHTKQWKAVAEHAPAAEPDEKLALQNYKGSGYISINDCLRHQDNCNNSHAPKIAKYLDRASLPEAMTLYRGVKGDYAKVLRSIVTEGTVFTDKGFMSTSTDPSVAKNFESGLTLKINAPKGAKAAAYVRGYTTGSYGGLDGEHEILFQRGTKMRVKSYDPKTRTLDVDVVHEAAATPTT